ncbi:MAG: PEGA domain-containing protein [Bryobacteraceae bacterium]
MQREVILAALFTTVCAAQVMIQDGTKVRIRLDQMITSATAEVGQAVELSVAEAIKVDDVVVIAEGARVTGTITEAVEKRRMGRAGKLDFSIDRVRAVDNEWIPLRYSLQKKSGQSHAVRTGVITAGVAVVFWPAAPVMLLMKGKDITINKGVTFDVFTDSSRTVSEAHKGPVRQTTAEPAPRQTAPPPVRQASPALETGTASVTVISSKAGADIEVDDVFVGSTPTTVQLKPGQHSVSVKAGGKVWQRTLQVTAGSTVSLNAVFP